MGANYPEEPGAFFAWGEIAPKTSYSRSTYKWGTSTALTKYCTAETVGTVDNITLLESEDDAATYHWGNDWQMPTQTMINELVDNCPFTAATQEGIEGYIVTGKNGNSIFLPVVGYKNSSTTYSTSSYYWSKSSRAGGTKAYMLNILSPAKNAYADRNRGGTVRPVSAAKAVRVKSLALNSSARKMEIGETFQLTAIAQPANATDQSVTWTSSDESVASVSPTGLVTAKKKGSAVITAKTNDGTNLSASCTMNVASSVSEVFADGTSYTGTFPAVKQSITYTRNFNNTSWQALYIPFAIAYEDWADDFEIAKINNFHEYDDDQDGEVDRRTLEIIKIKSGATKPNYPYLIKAKTTGAKTITVNNKTLYPAEVTSISCASVSTTYTFTGTYEPVTNMKSNGYYALSGGELKPAATDAGTLSPYRWYMSEASAGSDYSTTKAKTRPISIKVFGEEEDESTGVESIETSKQKSGIYNLNGQFMGFDRSILAPGIYIENSKKIVIRH